MRVRAQVTGKVQGVYYRASTQETAQQLGLTGWVQNQVDGRVLFEAQGPAEAIMALLDWARRGPAAAQVQALNWEEVVTKQPVEEWDFRIR